MENVAKSATPAPLGSPLQFEFSMGAANHNSNLLEDVGYDLRTFIAQHPGSTISYGSELRPINQLEPLLHHHPTFQCFKENHLNGIDYPIKDIDESKRMETLEATIERGNHKFALKDKEMPHCW